MKTKTCFECRYSEKFKDCDWLVDCTNPKEIQKRVITTWCYYNETCEYFEPKLSTYPQHSSNDDECKDKSLIAINDVESANNETEAK